MPLQPQIQAAVTELSVLCPSVQGTLIGRAGKPADGVTERRVPRHDGAPGPVEARVDSLNDRPAEQDVHPRIEDLVPSGEAYAEQ